MTQRPGHMWNDSELSRAENALHDLCPDTDDRLIAEHVADCLLALRLTPRRQLGIFDDCQPMSADEREYVLRVDLLQRRGPCPLSYDWHETNVLGISTDDRERARQWIIEAQARGYAVLRCWSGKDGGGSGKGTIAEWRRQRERRTAARVAV
jgi:hypothetical protein